PIAPPPVDYQQNYRIAHVDSQQESRGRRSCRSSANGNVSFSPSFRLGHSSISRSVLVSVISWIVCSSGNIRSTNSHELTCAHCRAIIKNTCPLRLISLKRTLNRKAQS